MKQTFKAIMYSFPLQLLLLHFKKFQILMVFWMLLFAAVSGHFMKAFGVNALYLAPEYLGKVNAIGASILGISIGLFIMSWNITTFILFCRHFKFLATTTKPFLKYCINNSIIPLTFLFYYFGHAVYFDMYRELTPAWEIVILTSGFLFGFIFSLAISFLYFFRADRTITQRMITVINNPSEFKSAFSPQIALTSGNSRLIKVTSYLNTPFTVRPVRDVSHYSGPFIDTVFSRHNFAAMLSVFIAFVFLIIVGFFLDHHVFQLPAAASITLFLAILVAVAGAFSYFMQSWSVPFFILFLVVLNILYKYEVIDLSNKAYGLNYSKKNERAIYNSQSLLALSTPQRIAQDKQQMIKVLENWKKKQPAAKPLLFIVNVSGGGTRSATFTLSILQRLDSLCGGKLMDKTFLITGASGGMLGAAYYRELAKERTDGKNVHTYSRKYIEDISKDLLNPTFSSFIARDMTAPAQRFKIGDYYYIKDRGYAFEQKLSENTHGLLNKQLKDVAADEQSAKVPLMIFNAVITRDGRKMVIGTQPVSFLMRPYYDSTLLTPPDPDVVDFGALFANQDPMNLRMLTALRMNATFPYVLPNVWLPSTPVIDVMDAGLRDNYGPETALRFIDVFKDWIKENTSGVVMIQIRDRKVGGWENPFESGDISELFTKPLLLLQYNWYKMQEYSQDNMISLTQQTMEPTKLYKITFQYVAKTDDEKAALNFHLTQREKVNILSALDNDSNVKGYIKFCSLLHKDTTFAVPLLMLQKKSSVKKVE